MFPLVDVETLINLMNEDTNLVLLDASPAATATGKPSPYPDVSIASARIIDLKKDFSDTSAPFPNTLPSATHFQEQARHLGINASSRIVVFDSFGIYTAPRMWWLFRTMGHAHVQVLDGGLPAWIEAGLPTTSRKDLATEHPLGNFTADYQPDNLITYDDIVANTTAPTFQIVDARSAGRFAGTSPEPRAHLPSGSMPHSCSLPYKDLLDGYHMKPAQELAQIFDERVGPSQDLVYSCGSGLTACIVMLAAHLAGRESMRLYDGSWTEYATRGL